jgi:hypothetical protein
MQHREPVSKSLWLGVLLIALGILFLASQLFGFNLFRVFSVAWPVYILVPGILLMLVGYTSGKSGIPITSLGSVVTMTGLIFVYQTVFNAFETWAYAWTLYPAAVGATMLLHHYRYNAPDTADAGLRLVSISVVLFVIFWTFFELIIGLRGPRNDLLSKLVGPALLIGVGAYLLRDQLFGRGTKSNTDEF